MSFFCCTFAPDFILANYVRMIEYIKGILTELNPTTAVVEAAGVGYSIAITLPTYSALVGKEQSNDGMSATASLNDAAKLPNDAFVKLFITEVIREDTHELYGFAVKAERQLFELLMTVSGVGAATARMILSAFTAEELRMLIATGNTKAMSKVKGLGTKTAQRIIVDLKDKALKLDLGGDPTELPLETVSGEGLAVSGVRSEAISALTMLGFPTNASGKAVDKILKNDPTMKVEAVIREALKML
jgi:Holliday junction DNA helicase RuvA